LSVNTGLSSLMLHTWLLSASMAIQQAEDLAVYLAYRCTGAAHMHLAQRVMCHERRLPMQVLLELPHIDTGVLDKFRQALACTPGDKEQRALVKKLLTGVGESNICCTTSANACKPSRLRFQYFLPSPLRTA